MTELLFQKATTGLAPACEEANYWLRKKKIGAVILVEPREPRNGAFFRKWWALIDLAFSYWRDGVKPMEYKGEPVQPNFERFRKDVTIKAGFFDVVVNINGELRLEARSLAWAKMDEIEFTKLYDATIAVLLNKVFNGQNAKHLTETELRSLAKQITEFAG